MLEEYEARMDVPLRYLLSSEALTLHSGEDRVRIPLEALRLPSMSHRRRPRYFWGGLCISGMCLVYFGTTYLASGVLAPPAGSLFFMILLIVGVWLAIRFSKPIYEIRYAVDQRQNSEGQSVDFVSIIRFDENREAFLAFCTSLDREVERVRGRGGG